MRKLIPIIWIILFTTSVHAEQKYGYKFEGGVSIVECELAARRGTQINNRNFDDTTGSFVSHFFWDEKLYELRVDPSRNYKLGAEAYCVMWDLRERTKSD